MWLHLPSTSLASALAAADSTWDCDSVCPELARSATWREKSLQPASWRRALQRAPWTMRLSGLTCSPSTRELGVELWIASLAASHASPTASPESASERPTSETSGLPLHEWYTTLRLQSASSRTSPAFFPSTTEKSDPSYEAWATTLRRASSRRRKSARHIFASASTSWPSPQTADGERGSETLFRGEGNPTLLGASRNWPGVTAKDATNRAYQRDGGEKGKERLTLAGEARSQWQTPSVVDTKGGHLSRGHDRSNELLLRGQAKAWSTPRKSDANGTGEHGMGGLDYLRTQVEASAWPTPATRDYKGNDLESRQGKPSLPALVTQMAGVDGSQTGRVLNPRFVEMLMGWPSGQTDYESSETALCRWSQLMRGVLCRLGWECSYD